MPKTTHSGRDAAVQECIENCTECHATCLSTAAHCLEKGGEHARPEHMTLLLDCAQICATSADFMLRNSERHHVTCGACAEICRACAEDCEQMADDPVMQRCAEMSRTCAESCERMAAG